MKAGHTHAQGSDDSSQTTYFCPRSQTFRHCPPTDFLHQVVIHVKCKKENERTLHSDVPYYLNRKPAGLPPYADH